LWNLIRECRRGDTEDSDDPKGQKYQAAIR
jgi:hypothetical protein